MNTNKAEKSHLTTLNPNHFKMIEVMGLNYCIEVPLNGIISLPNFIKIYQSLQSLIVGGDTLRQTGDIISLILFLESRLTIQSSEDKTS
jgi:hypothetical protein